MNKTIIEPNLVVINSSYMDNNSYIIFNQKEAIVIDPSFSGDDIIKSIPNDIKVIAILLTHAHFDHCFDTGKLVEKYKCPVYIHEGDKLTYTKYRYEDLADLRMKDFSKYIHWFNKSEIVLGNFDIKTIHTPGHSAGSVVYKYKNWIFVGDTLFYNSYGRTDLGNSNPMDMVKSLNLLWKQLHEENLILPGHSKWATFKEVQANNYMVKQLIKK